MSELYSALVKAQSQIESAVKDKTNPHYKSKYADLSAIWDACKKALTDNKLAILQFPLEPDEQGRLRLKTVVCHASGEKVEEVFALPVQKQDAHGYGSAITYARRFCLAAVLGVVADEDDDGNASTNGKAQITPRAGAREKLSEARLRAMEGHAEQIRALLQRGVDLDAAETYMKATSDTDEKIALWDMFDSKERRRLKEAGEVVRNLKQQQEHLDA